MVPGSRRLFGRAFDMALTVILAKRIKVIMDGNNSDPVTLETKSLQKALKHVEIFLPNRREILRMTGKEDIESAMKVVAEYSPLVVVKAGADGMLKKE